MCWSRKTENNWKIGTVLSCSSKDGEITGEKVHQAYWEENRIEEIVKYCEKDVNVLIDVIIKLKDLK